MSRRAPMPAAGERFRLQRARMAPNGRLWSESPVEHRWLPEAGIEAEPYIGGRPPPPEIPEGLMAARAAARPRIGQPTVTIHRWWGGPDVPPDTRDAVIAAHPNAMLIEHRDVWEDDGRVAPDDIWRHASNVLRYRWLYYEGGLWLDYDVYPLTDLTAISDQPWTAAWGHYREGSSMFFPEPGHPWLKKMLDTIESFGPSTESAPNVSGMRMLNLYPDSSVGKENRVVPPGPDYAPVTEQEQLAIHGWLTTNSE